MSHSLWLRFMTVCALSFVQAFVSTDLGVVREVTSRCRRLKRARGRGTMGTPVALQIFVAAAKAVVRVFIIAALRCFFANHEHASRLHESATTHVFRVTSHDLYRRAKTDGRAE